MPLFLLPYSLHAARRVGRRQRMEDAEHVGSRRPGYSPSLPSPETSPRCCADRVTLRRGRVVRAAAGGVKRRPSVSKSPGDHNAAALFQRLEGRTDAELKTMLDAAHRAMLAAFKVPERDRYQIVNEYKPSRMVVEDTGLGIPRTDKVVVVQVISRPRGKEAKQTFYRLLDRGAAGELRHRAVRRDGLDDREHRRGLVVRAWPRAVPRRRPITAVRSAAAANLEVRFDVGLARARPGASAACVRRAERGRSSNTGSRCGRPRTAGTARRPADRAPRNRPRGTG